MDQPTTAAAIAAALQGNVERGEPHRTAAWRRLAAPALYSTVAKGDNLGLVVGQPLIAHGTVEVAVEWEDDGREFGVTVEDVADLLTEYGRCDHGGRPGGPSHCGMDTAPGHERCEAHGGASPITVDVRRG